MNRMNFSYAVIETGMGWVGILGSEDGLRQIVLSQASPQAVIYTFDEHLEGATNDISLFGDLPKRLIAYFNGEVVTFPDHLDLADATPFQCSVWQIVRSIPYGQTESYARVAQQIGKPQGVRAVGQALARNPLPIVVPCHRVIGAGGEIGGFSYGSEMKQQLRQMETVGIRNNQVS